MLYVFWVISFLGSFMYAFSRNNKKALNSISLSIHFIFLFIMLGWARGAYDIEIGILRYNNFADFQSFTEVGYSILIELAHKLNLDYRDFFLLTAFAELTTLFWFVKKNTVKSPIVLGIFLIWPLCTFFQYTRNLLAFTFIIIGFDYLINHKKHYGLKYIFCCLLAASIHFSSLFFLLYLAISFLSKKTTFIVTILGFILLYFSFGLSLFSYLIEVFVGTTRAGVVARSVNEPDGMVGRTLGILLYILMFFSMYLILEKIYKVKMTDRKSDLIYKINTLSILFIPLTIYYGIGFARFPILIIIFNYCFFVSKISYLKAQKKRLFLYLILSIFILGILYINARNEEYRNLVIYPFFQQNELINSI